MDRVQQLRKHLTDACESVRKAIALLESAGAAPAAKGSAAGILEALTATPTSEAASPASPDTGSPSTDENQRGQMPPELVALLSDDDDEREERSAATRELTRREHPDAGIIVEHLPPEYGDP